MLLATDLPPDVENELFEQEQHRQRQRKALRLLLWQALKATDLPEDGLMEEVLRIGVDSTGYRGGDAGHGGCSLVRFDFRTCGAGFCTNHNVTVKLSNGDVINYYTAPLTGALPPAVTVEQVEIQAHGDWEQAGLYRALTAAAMQLAEALEDGATGEA